MVISKDKMKNKELTEDFTKEAKEVLDKLESDGWTTLRSLTRDGDRYFYLLRKLQRDENGNPVKGIWKAVDEKTGEEFDISYAQALGREHIVGDKKVSELSKKLGKALLPHIESMDESMDDVLKDYESIEKFLEKNNYTNYDLMGYNEYPMGTSKISIRVDGDWKHDHLYFQDLIEQWAEENNRDIFKIDKDVEPSDSDWYAATYHIYVTKDKDSLDKLNSMRRLFASESLDESLLQDLQDDFSMARKNWDDLNLGIDFDSALEKWNNESELAEKETFYSKPIYSKEAWEDMVSMFSKNESLKESIMLNEDTYKKFKRKNYKFSDLLPDMLGLDWYSDPRPKTEDGENFTITVRYPSNDTMKNLKSRLLPKLKEIGAKKISYDGNRYSPEGHLYFFIPKSVQDGVLDKLNQKEDEREAEYKSAIEAEDISAYKPTEKILAKLRDYRDRGSHINTKAIKDVDKALTYLCAALMLDMEDASALEKKAIELGANRSTINAIYEFTNAEESDDRSKIEKDKGLSKSGLFTFDSNSCWLPKKFFQFLIDHNIPAHFLGRKPGSHFDNNGVQWTETERVVLFPGTDKEFEFDVNVHTLESGGATTYSSYGTDLRTSITNVIHSLERQIENKGILTNESLKEDRERKTKDVYVVQGNYGYGWDDLVEEDSWLEAKIQLKTYRENEPQYSHRIVTRRQKLNTSNESLKEEKLGEIRRGDLVKVKKNYRTLNKLSKQEKENLIKLIGKSGRVTDITKDFGGVLYTVNLDGKDWDLSKGDIELIKEKDESLKESTHSEYITSDLAEKTSRKVIKDLYDRNDLSIIKRGDVWYTEGCPVRYFNIVKEEMKKYFPELTYLYDIEPYKPQVRNSIGKKLTEEDTVDVDELKESAERTGDLDTGIKDETETIDLYDDFMKKDCFDETDKELIKGIRDDEKDHRRILRDMKAGKKNIKADEFLKESDDDHYYYIKFEKPSTYSGYDFLRGDNGNALRFSSPEKAEEYIKKECGGKFDKYSVCNRNGKPVESTNTKINIRESLNKIDWDTDNKYDLRNMYDASKMEYKDKIELAKKISLNESYENLYSYLKKFI